MKTLYEIYHVVEKTEDGNYIPIFRNCELAEFMTFEEANEERIYLQPDYDNILFVAKESFEIVS